MRQNASAAVEFAPCEKHRIEMNVEALSGHTLSRIYIYIMYINQEKQLAMNITQF